MTSIKSLNLTHLAVSILLTFVLSACATAYGDRGGEAESPLKRLAVMGGLATQVPEPKEFVKDSRSTALGYIPIATPTIGSPQRTQPLSPEELLLLQKKLGAAQRENNMPTTAD